MCSPPQAERRRSRHWVGARSSWGDTRPACTPRRPTATEGWRRDCRFGEWAERPSVVAVGGVRQRDELAQTVIAQWRRKVVGKAVEHDSALLAGDEQTGGAQQPQRIGCL